MSASDIEPGAQQEAAPYTARIINRLDIFGEEMLATLDSAQVALGELACRPTTEQTLEFTGSLSDVLDDRVDRVVGAIAAINETISAIDTRAVTDIPVPAELSESTSISALGLAADEQVQGQQAEHVAGNEPTSESADAEATEETEKTFEQYVEEALARIA